MIEQGGNLSEVRSAKIEGSSSTGRGESRPGVESAVALAESCGYERGHSQQVTRLALQLFDGLRQLHGLGDAERLLLECGAVLHDIGFAEGAKGHHKRARRMILEAEGLRLGERDRRIVALLARYHRKAEPSEEHAEFAMLTGRDREIVRALAGILRVADGLDRTHTSACRSLACEDRGGSLLVRCRVPGPAESEAWAAKKKGGLLEEVFGRELKIEMMQEGT